MSVVYDPQTTEPIPQNEIENVWLSGNGSFGLKVKGESHYQDAIAVAVIKNGIRGKIKATLVLEDNNRYDKNAVRVEIDGRTIGYLSRATAPLFREQLAQQGHPHATCSCRAKVTGGTLNKPNYIVSLDVPVEFEDKRMP